MKAWAFDAVTYDGEVYCTECLPKGVKVTNEGVTPIFASDEWDAPGAACSECGELHDYMNLIGGEDEIVEEETEDIDEE